jgi:hypothetical protein
MEPTVRSAPDLQRLLDDIRARKIDVIVVYKVDRLTRSLADFAKLVELFDAQGVSFVSVTQQFNTTTSMGRLTLNVLLSFAQFEREVTSPPAGPDSTAPERVTTITVSGSLLTSCADAMGPDTTINASAVLLQLARSINGGVTSIAIRFNSASSRSRRRC